jgi:hypothetical protein
LCRYITTGFGNFWMLFLASIIVAFIPVLAIFAAFQRWFIAGLTSGGVSDPDASRVSRLARLWNAPLYSTWEELLAVHGDAELAYVLVPHNAMREAPPGRRRPRAGRGSSRRHCAGRGAGGNGAKVRSVSPTAAPKKAVTLPAAYVREAVELGHATTIHAAQGVSADTTHGLVDELMTGEQLLHHDQPRPDANRLYVAVGEDGDPHRIVHPEIQEAAFTDILQKVLSRTSRPVSATTIGAQHGRAAAAAVGSGPAPQNLAPPSRNGRTPLRGHAPAHE